MMPMDAKIRVLIAEDEITAKIAELAAAISRDYAGKDLILVCILKGSMPFFVDLAREISIPVVYDYLGVSSYEGGTESTGVVRFQADLSENIGGRHVLLVEDIVDSGRTMSYLFDALAARRPASLKLVTLLDKPERRETPVEIAYTGFQIPNEFVIGYGLDYAQYYRNLPYVGVLEEIPDDVPAT